MTPPSTKSKTLRDLQKTIDESVDYESETDFMRPKKPSLITITTKDSNSRASSSYLERGAADTLVALRTSPDVTSTAVI